MKRGRLIRLVVKRRSPVQRFAEIQKSVAPLVLAIMAVFVFFVILRNQREPGLARNPMVSTPNMAASCFYSLYFLEESK